MYLRIAPDCYQNPQCYEWYSTRSTIRSHWGMCIYEYVSWWKDIHSINPNGRKLNSFWSCAPREMSSLYFHCLDLLKLGQAWIIYCTAVKSDGKLNGFVLVLYFADTCCHLLSLCYWREVAKSFVRACCTGSPKRLWFTIHSLLTSFSSLFLAERLANILDARSSIFRKIFVILFIFWSNRICVYNFHFAWIWWELNLLEVI